MDFDRDGDMDAFVPSGGTDVAVFRRDATGFTAVRTVLRADLGGVGDELRGILPADWDGDGATELVLVWNYNVGFLDDDGAGGLAAAGAPMADPSSNTIEGAAVLDDDGDGDLDLLVAGEGRVHLLENDGAGSFTVHDHPFPSLQNAEFLAASRVDGDGRVDLFVRSTGTSQLLLSASAASGWTASLDAFGGNGNKGTAVFCDVDADSDLDLFATGDPAGASNAQTDRWYANTGAALALPAVGAPAIEAGSRGAACGDLDHDGHLDLLVADDGVDRFHEGDGTLPVGPWPGGAAGEFLPGVSANSASPVLVDWDGDGDLDALVTVRSGADHLVLRNTTDDDASFQVYPLHPVGTCASPLYRDAFGTRIRLVVGGTATGPLVEIAGGTGRGQLPWPVAHFGGVDPLVPIRVRVRRPNQTAPVDVPVTPADWPGRRLVLRLDDLDGDGIRESQSDDTDGDGLVDDADLDADGDGCDDAVEAGPDPCAPLPAWLDAAVDGCAPPPDTDVPVDTGPTEPVHPSGPDTDGPPDTDPPADTVDTEPVDRPPARPAGCGCAGVRPPAPLALVALIALRRRARRRTAGPTASPGERSGGPA